MNIWDNLEHFHLKSANPPRYARRRQGKRSKKCKQKKAFRIDLWYVCSDFLCHKRPSLVWGQLWNFSVVQLKFDRLLHLNEPPKMIFCYLVRHFDWRLSKVGHFQFSKSILEAKTQLDLPETDFLIWILN